ncbi:MAG: transposase, partial [Chitinophagaceae bacterium]|nr:transposase [Chitinophagaceae bacterium]
SDLLEAVKSYPRNRIVQRETSLLDVNIATDWTRGGAGTVYTVSGEKSRRKAQTLKVDMTSASADAIFSWSNATGITPDPVDQLLSIDVYIPEIIQTGITGGGVSISVFITNNTTLPATQIATIYKNRWMIELLFKQIKQNFRCATSGVKARTQLRFRCIVC